MTDLPADFFLQDALEVAPWLLGCRLAVDGRELIITETEAYRSESDTACHAHHGRTKRTEMLYRRGGYVYVYLCYGIHSLLNIITGPEDDPPGCADPLLRRRGRAGEAHQVSGHRPVLQRSRYPDNGQITSVEGAGMHF